MTTCLRSCDMNAIGDASPLSAQALTILIGIADYMECRPW